VVLAEKMPIKMDTNAVNDVLLDEMVNNLSNLASVYYKPVSLVTSKSDEMAAEHDYEDGEPERPIQAVVQEAAKALGGDVGNLLDLDFGASKSETSSINIAPDQTKRVSTIDEMLGSVDSDSLSMPFSLYGSPASGVMPNPYSLTPGFSFPKTSFLSSSDCKGLSLEVLFIS
jgi:AP-1 complex subunit beta-1